jgi:hypothetical protein
LLLLLLLVLLLLVPALLLLEDLPPSTLCRSAIAGDPAEPTDDKSKNIKAWYKRS